MTSGHQTSIIGLVAAFLGEAEFSEPRRVTDTAATGDTSVLAPTGTQYISPCSVPRVNVVIFSKDRPWQLQQLFRSMALDDKSSAVGISVSLQLVLHVTESYRLAYDEVIAAVETKLQDVTEISMTCYREDPTDDSSFQSLVEQIFISNVYLEPSSWMFLTDDCLLLVSLKTILIKAAAAFATNPSIHCFLSRMHPGITWAQTKSMPSPPPRFFMRYIPGRTPTDNGVFVYPLNRGDLDWAYPWDLSGGVYPHSVVKTVWNKLQGTDGLSHPNRMEIAGNGAIASEFPKNILVFIPTCPLLLILAINRVQNVYQAPLACSQTVSSSLSPIELLTYYHERKHLGLDRYRVSFFNSSHVGDVHLLSESCSDESDKLDTTVTASNRRATPALSVLIPVHAGPPDAAAHAIMSILMQPVDEYIDNMQQSESLSFVSLNLALSPMQVVLVDDRCKDGSVDAMMEAAHHVSTMHSFVNITTTDYRVSELSATETSAGYVDGSMGEARVKISIDVVSSRNAGVAAALNHGLSYCNSDLVARMDADDISAPGRLREQVALMRHGDQADTDVVGTSIAVFRVEDDASSYDNDRRNTGVALSTSNAMRLNLPASVLPYYSSTQPSDNEPALGVTTSLYPTDAGFAAWTMLFSCSIAHPSVLYRKKAVMNCNGYDETYSYAEDYNLWLRMTNQKCSSVVSMPRIGLWHRKHRSRPRRSSRQMDEALRASMASMEVLLKGSDGGWSGARLEAAARSLRQPAITSSLIELNEATGLLVALESAFKAHHGDALTRREVALIGKDCSERIGEMATMAVERSLIGPSDTKKSLAWKLWNERCPELTMNRIALFCHKYRGERPR